MVRGISTKWMLGVLLSLALPLMGFAWYVRTQVTIKRAEDVMRFHLASTAADLAEQLQAELLERQQDVELLSSVQMVHWFVEDGNSYKPEAGSEEGALEDGDRMTFLGALESLFNDQVELAGVYNRIVALDRSGSVVGWNTWANGRNLTSDELLDTASMFYGDEDWFEECMETGSAVIDVHVSDFAPKNEGGSQSYHVGFASRIRAFDAPGSPGAVVAFMDWRHVQSMLDRYGVRRLGSGNNAEENDIYSSSYAWIWGADGDTILAHNNRLLYGQRVSELEQGNLHSLVKAAQSAPYGMYPDYNFKGEGKRGAFHRLQTKLGLGWVVGVGIKERDIYEPVALADRVLLWASILSLLLAGCLAWWVARRMTRPVLLLKEQADRVAAGDLEARVDVRGNDEIADLSHAFNAMTHDLAENRDRLIKAEKESAWREMALQVAHEIKNPLTPIRLSVGLLRRIWKERREEFEPALHSTLDMIERQVDTMKDVTRDFSDFAGTHKKAEAVAAGPLLARTLQLTEAWSADLGVEVHEEGLQCEEQIHVHPGEMQRALVNLVSNALEAMPNGGELHARVVVEGQTVMYEIGDTGVGISQEAREHLFEPHFTTRGSGTGLGLAIVRRVVESRGGSVTIDDNESGPGAIATIRLPLAQDAEQNTPTNIDGDD